MSLVLAPRPLEPGHVYFDRYLADPNAPPRQGAATPIIDAQARVHDSILGPSRGLERGESRRLSRADGTEIP